MYFKKECVNTSNDRIIVCQENKSRIEFLNEGQKEVSKIIIDGCQIQEGLRCDYLILEDDKENYIELKGHNLSHGVRQIKKTIELCSSDIKNRIKRSFIICTRVPVSSAEIQNLRLKFKRDFNSDLIVKSSPHIYTL